MKSSITTGILISTYNWPEALEQVLISISNQTLLPDEILIADDGSTESTSILIEKFRNILSIPIRHSWQEDLGFRKARVLNMAIKSSKAEYIIEIDGDIILHPNFVEDHLRHAESGKFIQGCRASLNEVATHKFLRGEYQRITGFSTGIKNRFNSIRFTLLSFMIKANKTSSHNTKACNLAFWKKDYIAVNGYNNQFQGWGWEDYEFAARLINSGVKKKRLKLAAICFHLYHELNSKSEEKNNELRYIETINTEMSYCKDGFNQI